MIEKYEVVVSYSDESLFITAVNDLIMEGYQPYGEPVFIAQKGTLTFIQVMVKEKQPPLKVGKGSYRKV